MIPANQLGPEFVPRPTPTARQVLVGNEVVLVDGWTSATVLSPAAATIWASFDGTATLAEVTDELTELTGVDRTEVGNHVLDLARRVGSIGLLEGVGPRDDIGLDVRLEAMPRFEALGTPLPHFVAIDSDGVEAESTTLGGTPSLLVNWNPHCGYCVSIAHLLAGCEEGLKSQGVTLILLASGSVAANRDMADGAGLHHAKILQPVDGHPHPLPGIGTPAAYHLDKDLCLASPPAYGNVDVPALAARLAGVDLGNVIRATGEPADSVRYLLQPGGACAQGTGFEPVPKWVGTRVFRIGDFHVGLRCGTDETVTALEALFSGSTVEDPAAGHNFAVSLSEGTETPDGDHVTTGKPRAPHLLAQGSNVFVRSGSPGRVLGALLARLHDEIVGFDPTCGRLRVDATAALVSDEIVLLPPGVHVIAEKLEPLLAQRGIAIADFPHPEIDLDTCEVVLPEPAIGHDQSVLTAFANPVDPQFEASAVRPGRYRLTAWGVMHPGEVAVTRFTPAEAAVATLSFVQHTDDAPTRMRQLAGLFRQVLGFGIWYHSEADYADALCEALGIG